MRKEKSIREIVLFSKSLGLNNNPALSKPLLNPETGECELIDIDNMTTAIDGSLERINDVNVIYEHSKPILLAASNQDLFVFYDGDAVYKLNSNGSTSIVHTDSVGEEVTALVATQKDIRISSTTKNFVTSGGLSEELLVGENIFPDTSTIFSAMPLFSSAFLYNGILYSVNKSDARFLQYSKPYHYDLWDLANSFLSHTSEIRQASAIVSELPQQSGGICCLFDESVVVYDGASPEDFTQKTFNIKPFVGTLYSGLITKALGFKHVFVCDDGIYSIDSQGVMINMTIGKTFSLSQFNDYYTCAYVKDGKYVACGNKCSIEYDFITKTVSKASAIAYKAVSVKSGSTVFVDGEKVVAEANTASVSSSFVSTFTTPLSSLGFDSAKACYDMYFTGIVSGDVTITAISDTAYGLGEESWSVDISDLGQVSNYRIKLPMKHVGNRVSFRFDCFSGEFKVENIILRVSFSSLRSK